jgi:hypothetical protein
MCGCGAAEAQRYRRCSSRCVDGCARLGESIAGLCIWCSKLLVSSPNEPVMAPQTGLLMYLPSLYNSLQEMTVSATNSVVQLL